MIAVRVPPWILTSTSPAVAGAADDRGDVDDGAVVVAAEGGADGDVAAGGRGQPTPPLPAAATPPLTPPVAKTVATLVVPPEASVVAMPPATLTVESVRIDMSPP